MKKIVDSEGHSIQVIDLTKAIFEGYGDRYRLGIEALTKDSIAIYANDVVSISNPLVTVIPENRRKEIVATAVKLFESDGLLVEVYPPLLASNWELGGMSKIHFRGEVQWNLMSSIDKRLLLFCIGENCGTGKVEFADVVAEPSKMQIAVSLIDPTLWGNELKVGERFTIREASKILAQGIIISV
jgi:hypothetical protein